ncbi:hypothetical protein PENVUL_c024G04326 [Penicillium vulpinum]|uniref:NmrA-like domain-containing protein n=1 Tax=Penicillium vulpinum TaxID=29845 RepID=A0A1V6RV84_9EURO|nr:hypothetical protein PENVUL_c024G04326 [Penicillium vulpinum]
MVRIALAGGHGGLGREILDVLAASGQHEILILSRRDKPADETREMVGWARVDYNDKEQLVQALQDIHTVLSFIVVAQDKGNVSQRNLIDACVIAGVKRFAPSEWAGASTDGLPWYAGKTAVHQYLQEINREQKKTTKHLETWGIHVDMQNRRAILLADGKNPGYLSLTTVEDVANVVAKAVLYEGQWPEVGGIRGDELSMTDLVALGEKVRGGSFSVEKIKSVHARMGRLTASWAPEMGHTVVSEGMREAAAKIFTAKTILSIYQATWRVSDEWNQLLPDHKFTSVGAFLQEWWSDK